MPGPIENISAKSIQQAQQGGGTGGPAKTEFKLANAQETQKAGPTELPPMKEVNEVEKKQLQQDLRRRLEVNPSADGRQLFSSDVQETGKRLDVLRQRVDSAPKTPEQQPLRDRLSAIESQFNATSDLTNATGSGNLRDLLSLQTEIYKVSQNIELLSKVVDTATSGIKQTMQMQV